MSTNRLRSPSATNKWSTKIGENTRKNSLRASSTLDTGWSQDLQSHPLRSTASNIYQPNTCSSEHDLKRSEEKTSEETILIEVDGNVSLLVIHLTRFFFFLNLSRYVQLANKERRLQGEMIAVNHEMANLTTTLLNSTCETIAHYRTLMAAVDSPIGAPIKPAITDLRDAYRDPTRFRYSAIERPTIEPAKTINLLTVPETFTLWNEPFTDRTEYEDTISRLGLCNMRNRQQYLEPLPSSRNRFGDCRLQ